MHVTLFHFSGICKEQDEDQAIRAVLRVYSIHIRSPCKTDVRDSLHNPARAEGTLHKSGPERREPECCTRLQTTTTATTLATSRVGGSGGDVLDSADSHAGTGEGAESGLGAGTGGLGAVTYKKTVNTTFRLLLESV